ncbi:MAG: hypothetical protein IPL32_19215 [Chloracidobacterium sp.]|nr:hypothetical protein [Chloracidobacterium sp.]
MTAGDAEKVPSESFVEAVVRAATPEPAPARGRAVVLDDLVAQLRERSAFGLRKYGTVLETWNGRDAGVDAVQELLDLFVYLHQAAMERADLEVELARLRARVAQLEAEQATG